MLIHCSLTAGELYLDRLGLRMLVRTSGASKLWGVIAIRHTKMGRSGGFRRFFLWNGQIFDLTEY